MDFHSELNKFVKARDLENANSVILNELANALLKDREDFIEVLRSSGIEIRDTATDVELVDAFTNNTANKTMMLGMAYLVNHRNRTTNFDGEEEVSDNGVKTSYKVMDEFFNAGGLATAITETLGKGAELGTVISQGQQKKKYGVTDSLARQQNARQQMTQSILAQKQAEAAEKSKEKDRLHSQKKTLLIVGGSILAIGLIAGVIYMIKKKK